MSTNEQSTPGKKLEVLDLAGPPPPPPSISTLSFEQRGTVLEQLLLDHTTSIQTRTLIRRIVEEPEKIAQGGLDSCVKSLELKMAGIAERITRRWDEELHDPDAEENEDKSSSDEDYLAKTPTDSGPEIAQALLPFVPLIAKLPSDHPTPSALTAAFDLFCYAIEQAFVVEGVPQKTQEFADAVDSELLKLVELRVQTEGKEWDPRVPYLKLVESRDCNGQGDKALCKLPKSIGRVKAMVEAAMEEEKKRAKGLKKAVGGTGEVHFEQ